ncbi:MAG TPA: hypothetical protein VEW48_27670 [Thermoanaerobaculia bacterium]|nr:hypothetical protein [Thermoanaerobaculia bacterium]
MAASPPYSDPVLTANLYCTGHLDEILVQVIAPWWGEIRQLDPDSGAFLWTMRSDKGGEHVKVRLHGPESLANPARTVLQQAADAFFGRVEPASGRPATGWKGAAINDDDEADLDHPDCSLRWTHYRRSRASLGPRPFLDDNGYVGRITRCMAAGCERVLLLEPDAAGHIPNWVRQSSLLDGLIAGLAAPGFPADARRAYLIYHRNALLRFTLNTENAEAGKMYDLLQLFERQVEAKGPTVDALRRTARSEWMRASTGEESAGAWPRSIANLIWYIRPLCEDPDYHVDPSADDPCFVPVFKVFHGLANQLGLNFLEEAFAHHLLASVTEDEASRTDGSGAGTSLADPSRPGHRRD